MRNRSRQHEDDNSRSRKHKDDVFSEVERCYRVRRIEARVTPLHVETAKKEERRGVLRWLEEVCTD